MLSKVLPMIDDAARQVAHVRAIGRVAPAARPYFTTGEETLASRHLVFTTIDSLGLQDIAGARL